MGGRVAFERALAQTATGKTAEAGGEHVLALYHGSFLGDTAAPWALPAREKLRTKFVRFLTQASRQCMQEGRHEDALWMLDKGVEADPLAEELYCCLMRCHAALGRRAEALAAYQRCHKMLSTQLGIDPTPKTQALHRALHDNQPPSP